MCLESINWLTVGGLNLKSSSNNFLSCQFIKFKPEGKPGPLKMWHRNHLLPLSDAVRVPQVSSPLSFKPTPPRTRSRQRLPTCPVVQEEEESEDEEIVPYWLWPSTTEADTETNGLRKERRLSIEVEKSPNLEVDILSPPRRKDKMLKLRVPVQFWSRM